MADREKPKINTHNDFLKAHAYDAFAARIAVVRAAHPLEAYAGTHAFADRFECAVCRKVIEQDGETWVHR